MKFIDQITWFANKVRSLMPRQTSPKVGQTTTTTYFSESCTVAVLFLMFSVFHPRKIQNVC
jgi:hypothetical protein